MTKSIEQRIFAIYEKLSPSERRLADVMLEHQQNMASYTALELSEMANVSNATAARLLRRLGYESVNDARRHARTAQHWGSPLARLEDAPETDEAGPTMAQMARADSLNLKMTDENLNPAELAQAVEILHSSSRVWLWGVRHGFGLAHLAKYYLSFALTDVHVIPSGSGLSEDFAAFRPNDALVVFAFRRRPASLPTLLAEARKLGLRIILIADTSAARSTPDVEIVLRCWCNSPAIFTSLTASVSVVNYLSWALMEKVGDKRIQRLKAMENLLAVTDDIGSAKASKKTKPRKAVNHLPTSDADEE